MWERIGGALRGLGGALGGICRATVERVIEATAGVVAGVVDAIEAAAEAVAGVVDAIVGATVGVVSAVEAVVSGQSDVLGEVVAVAEGVAGAVKGAIQAVVTAIRCGAGCLGMIAEGVAVVAVIGGALWLGLTAPLWVQIPLGWGLGLLCSRYGLGAAILTPCLLLPSLIPICIGAYLVSLLSPNIRLDGESWTEMDFGGLMIGAMFAGLYIFLGQVIQKSLMLTTIIYAVIVLTNVLRAGEKWIEAAMVMAGLTGVMMLLHAFNVPIMALFASFSLCRLFFQPERTEVSDPDMAVGCSFLSAAIPGVNANALARIIYGHRTDLQEVRFLEPCLEWAAAISFLFIEKADGKTLLGAYLNDAGPALALPAILATLIAGGTYLFFNQPPEVVPQEEPQEPTAKPYQPPAVPPALSTGLQLVGSLAAVAILNPHAILVPFALAPALYLLHKYWNVDARVWCIPAFVATAA